MSDEIKLLSSRWNQEEFFSVSDAVLIANGLDRIFKTIEEFEKYAEEISHLWGIEINRAISGDVKGKQLHYDSKVSKCGLDWMNWTKLCFDHVCLNSVEKLEKLTLEEFDQLKKQVSKHLSIFEKLILSKKLGNEYISEISSVTKKYLDFWLIDSVNENYLSKSLMSNFLIEQEILSSSIDNNANENETACKATPANSENLTLQDENTGLPRQIGMLSMLMYVLTDKPELLVNIKRKEDIKKLILKVMGNYEYKQTKPLGLSKRSIEQCFSEINRYWDKYPLPQFP